MHRVTARAVLLPGFLAVLSAAALLTRATDAHA